MKHLSKKILSLILVFALLIGTLPNSIIYAEPTTSASLSGISINSGELEPNFDQSIFEYTVMLENSETTIDITPAVTDGTEIRMRLIPIDSGKTKTYNMYVGENIINIDVNIAGQEESIRYTLNIIRKDSNELRGLSGRYIGLEDGKNKTVVFNPKFLATETNYITTVPANITEITLNPTLPFNSGSPWITENHQIITINGVEATPNLANKVSIAAEDTEVSLTVTPTFSSPQTYTIKVNKVETFLQPLAIELEKNTSLDTIVDELTDDTNIEEILLIEENYLNKDEVDNLLEKENFQDIGILEEESNTKELNFEKMLISEEEMNISIVNTTDNAADELASDNGNDQMITDSADVTIKDIDNDLNEFPLDVDDSVLETDIATVENLNSLDAFSLESATKTISPYSLNAIPELTGFTVKTTKGIMIGELTPGKNEYRFDIDYINLLTERIATIEASAPDGVNIKINKIPTDFRTYRLELGEQIYQIEASNGNGEKTLYTIVVVMKDVSKISSVSIKDVYDTNLTSTLEPKFNALILDYTMTLSDTVSQISLNVGGGAESQKITVNGATYVGVMPVDVPYGSSVITINVKPTFQEEQAYTITLNRLLPPDEENSLQSVLNYYAENPVLTLKQEIIALMGAGKNAQDLNISEVTFTHKATNTSVADRLAAAQSVIAITALGGNLADWNGKDFGNQLQSILMSSHLFHQIAQPPVQAISVVAMNVGAIDYTTSRGTLEGALFAITKNQNADGSFKVSPTTTYNIVEGTAASILALAPYKDVPENKEYIEKALAYLKSAQTENGFISSVTKRPSAKETAMVISALVALGENVVAPEWTVDGIHLKSALEKFQLPGGGFRLNINDATVDKEATALALIALGDIENNETAWLKFQPAPSDDHSIIERDKLMLNIGNTISITQNIMLPSVGYYGSEIEWSSSNSNYLTNEGIITRPQLSQTDATVILTATFKKGALTQTKLFTITVRATEAPADISDMIDLSEYYYKGTRNSQLGSWWDLGAVLSCWGSLDGYVFPDYTTDLNGVQPSEYVGRILGEISVGGNPYKTLTDQNLIKDLIDKYQGNKGEFGIINQHLWSIIALNAANAEGVYNASNPSKPYNKEGAVKSLIENFQNKSTGSFGGYDMTGMALIALSGSREIEGVDEAINKAINYLKNTQVKTGRYAGGWGENNSNTLATVISGLASVGENVASDKWTVNGINPLMTLKIYQVTDSNDFGYGGFEFQEGKGVNGMASYQAIIALGDAIALESIWVRIKYTGDLNTETHITKAQLELEIEAIEKINSADYTEETYQLMKAKLEAAKLVIAEANPTQIQLKTAYMALVAARNGLVLKTKPGPNPGDPSISVNYEIRGDRKMGVLFSGTVKNLHLDATVFDALLKASDTNSINVKYRYQFGTAYIEGINGLSEFDNGPNSGWKYKVNGTYPNIGAADYHLQNGDNFVWTYTDDYTKGDDYWMPTTGTEDSGGGSYDRSKIVVNILSSMGTNGIATSTISGTKLTNLIYDLNNLEDKDGAEVGINIDHNDHAKGIEITLPYDFITAFSSKDQTKLVIASEIGKISLDASAIYELAKAAEKGDVIFKIIKISSDELTLENRSLVGNHPVYELVIIANGLGFEKFDTGLVKVTLPYVLAKGESSDDLDIYYLGKSVPATEITNSKYDTELQSMIFSTNHFSVFAIVNKVMPEIEMMLDSEIPLESVLFKDVPETHWASDFIYFLAQSGIINGIGDDLFAPEKEITRAEFVTILANMSGDDLTSLNSRFSDVHSNVWYAKFITWAFENGITMGTSATTFSPDAKITRQEMAALIMNYLEYKGFSLEIVTEISVFTDDELVADYAKEAVVTMQRANIINGRGNNMFAPTAGATRAEAATMLAKILQQMEN